MIYPKLLNHIQKHFLNFETIAPERCQDLQNLALWMKQQLLRDLYLNTIVICTHNSRRSHLGQVLLAIAADYYQTSGINAYSGGTEATEFNYRMVSALTEIGLNIQKVTEEKNPRYNIQWGDSNIQILRNLFSKAYTDEVNPKNHFIAILVCDSADKNCPFVTGASKRMALPYKDPKVFDDTEFEHQAYIEKINEMGREFFYLINQVKELVREYQ